MGTTAWYQVAALARAGAARLSKRPSKASRFSGRGGNDVSLPSKLWRATDSCPKKKRWPFVFVPKYCRRSIYGALRREIGGILGELCQHQGVEIV